jgi:hypothetical protein
MHHGCVGGADGGGKGCGGVVADIAKLSVGREAYYTRELATDHEQYLSGHGESPGRWYGARVGIARAGRRSIGGRVPGHVRGPGSDDGGVAGPPPWPQRRAGVRRGPAAVKSVSILYGLGDPAIGRAVLAAHHAGLSEAVGYLDEHLGARRRHAGVQHVSGRGLLAVGFDHRTSREGDPLLHTQLVVANTTTSTGPTDAEPVDDGFKSVTGPGDANYVFRLPYQAA